MVAPAATTPAANMDAASRPAARFGRWRALLAALAALVVVAGLSGIDAPWLLGDELERIANSPLVHPQAAPGAPDSLGVRLVAAFRPQEGAYQPLATASWILQASAGGASPTAVRGIDLLLHACVAVLLASLLRGLWREDPGIGVVGPLLASGLALLWAAHPLLTWTWAAGAGRGHLLAAAALLLAGRWQVRALTPGREAWFWAAWLAVLAAQVGQPAPGWLGVVLLLEWSATGSAGAVRAARAGWMLLPCAAGALALAWTSGLMSLPGPVPIAPLAPWATESLATITTSFMGLLGAQWPPTYLPAPGSAMQDARVWAGGVLLFASLLLAVRAWRLRCTGQHHKLTAMGWAWFWLLLLPELMHAGGAPVDLARRLYVPSLGLVLVLAGGIAGLLRRAAFAAKPRAILSGAVLVAALGLLALSRPALSAARSTLARAQRALAAYPADPRVFESAAASCQYAAAAPPAPGDAARMPAGVVPGPFLRAEALRLLEQTAAADLSTAYPDGSARGRAHVRLAAAFLRAGRSGDAIIQAELGVAVLGEDFDAWRALAVALHAAGRPNEAARAYAECERRLPGDPALRAEHHAAFGALLMFELDRDDEACRRFQQAMETGRPPLGAQIGVAACHIRYGDGLRGAQIVSEALKSDPGNVQAGLVLAEYHLRSHHWEQARKLYTAILNDDPLNYVALRGLLEVALQTDRLRDAIRAWAIADELRPQRSEFRSFYVWTLALAADPQADDAAHELLGQVPDNPLACLALMLIAARSDRPDLARDWIRRAASGRPIPRARELDRAAAALQLLLGRGELPDSAVLVQCALYIETSPDLHEHAGRMLAEFRARHPDSPWDGLAAQLQEQSGFGADTPAAEG